MRHLKKGNTLGRNASHRKATFQALSVALLKEKRIKTTLTKAKALRSFIEPLITKAKNDTAHNRRQVFSKLQNKEAVSVLFDEVGPEASDRPGGYTRVLKLGHRSGDSAEIAVIELVDYNDVKPETSKETRKKTRRAGRSKKSTEAEKTEEKKSVKKEKKESSAEAEKSAVTETETVEEPEKKEKPAGSEKTEETTSEEVNPDEDQEDNTKK